jgi:NAD+ synthetase
MQVGPFFETGHLLVDLNESKRKAAIPQIELDEAEQLYKALSVGVRDYVHKCGFDSVLLGLSGGIDSAVTAAIAVEALGSDKVRGVALPSAYSSEGSVLDAADLADRLGIKLDRIPIEPTFQSLSQQLKPIFAGMAEDVTEENMQARIRGAMLMAMSNKLGALLLTTGNKSELAVGYCKLNCDMFGGLSVMSDFPKTMV